MAKHRYLPMKRIYLILIFFMTVCLAKAQDPHFSQFYENPVYLNPAMAGLNNCIMRMGGLYRDQWRSVSKPYRSYSFFADARLQPYEWKHDAFGVGLSFTGDKAGSANLGTNDFNVIMAYHKGFGDQNKVIMSLGLSAGFINHTIKSKELLFASQWNGFSFNQYLPSNEPAIDESVWLFDMNAGLNLTWYIKDYTVLTVGGSYNHLTAPEYSFMDGAFTTARKATLHAGLNFSVSQRTTLMPKVMVSMQNGSREVVLGFITGYYPRLEPVYLGLWYRWGSDIIPVVGFQFNGFALLASYDLNISRFSLASKLQGGFELSLVKNFLCADPFFKSKSKMSKDGKKTCPVF
jgi:type IX secretion system PorP/SprF family membrane protein